MPPPRTGSVEKRRRVDGTVYYRARIRLADDSRERVDVPDQYAKPAGGKTARERAELYALAVQEREDEGGEQGPLLLAKRKRMAEKAQEHDQRHGETWSKWFGRYLPTKECSEDHRRITKAIESKWIAPVLRTKVMASLTRDDVEDVRDRLDLALDEGAIRHSTARNAWSVLTGALKAAYGARDRNLRVLTAPLHFGLLPPKRGESRQRPWLYPREWAAFAAHDGIPIAFRQVCALALYTGLRPGELRALTWGDVDLEARTVSVSKALDGRGVLKAPKTASGQRVIPIQPALVPLLEAIAGDAAQLVLGDFTASEDHIAQGFRDHLATANVKRPRLTADNATEEPIDFRSLRDTHATWLAIDGVADKVIQRRMGHASPVTTDRYVKAAETFAAEHVGAPFPPLPASVIGPGLGQATRRGLKSSRKMVARVGFEPTTFGL